MITLCTHLQEQAKAGFEVIVVIGAGNGALLPTLRQLRAKRLVLIEAHPEQAQALARIARLDHGEEVRSLAVTTDNVAQATLHVFGNPKYNSLRAPLELKRFAPNLPQVGTVNVPAMSLEALLDELNLNPDATNLLILDTPGLCGDLLASIHPRFLSVFSWIILTGTEIPNVYSGDTAMASLVEQAGQLGFEHALSDPDALYPHAASLLHRDEERMRTLGLRQYVTELENAKQDLERTLQESRQKVSVLEAAHAQLTKERDALATEKANLAKARDEQTKLATERQTAL
ncbi:MAG: hypothetical protein EOM03_11900, partial [Clostridia bacterium]|nr:hypothetical protein [Clostridia bacterium]